MRVALTPGLKARAERIKADTGVYPEWYGIMSGAVKAGKLTLPVSFTIATRQAPDYEKMLEGAIAAAGLPAPETQYKWHPSRRFRADFAYPQLMLLIEVQGGVFQDGGGGHNRGASYEADRLKYNEAVLLGWRVLEFGPNHITGPEQVAITTIKRALDAFGAGVCTTEKRNRSI